VTDGAVPFGLDRQRHVELQGRSRHSWRRRAGLLLAIAVPVLALFDVFGQRPSYSNADSPAAAVRVDSPAHVRGGLIFTSKIVITPHVRLRDAQLWLASGWFAGMTFNGLAPQPSSETASGRWEVYDYGPLPAGTPFPVYVSWSVNPTNVGRHSQDVALHDGNTQILLIHRTITVFP
jgi:hypothetical protein